MMRAALLLAIMAAQGCAQTIEEAAGRLAVRLAKIAPGPMMLEGSTNRSSLTADFAVRARVALERELKSRRTFAGEPTAIKLTVSESASGPLLILTREDPPLVLMEPFAARTEAAQNAARIEMREVLRQRAPILDFSMQGDTLAVLEPGRLAFYRNDAGRWMAAGEAPIVHAATPPRDLRGRLLRRNNGFEVRLPGTSCTGAIPMTCKADESTWQEGEATVAWVKQRNFLALDPAKAGYYSVASLGGGRVVATPIAGGLRVMQEAQELAVEEKAGSDLAAIRGCGNGSVALLTGTEEKEALRAVEIGAGNATRAIAAAVTAAGPVTALWASENPGEASLVIRNTTTGEYEAYRVAVVCSR